MTVRKQLDEKWVEVDCSAGEVLLTDGPFNLHIGDDINKKPAAGQVFDPLFPGHLVNHALTLPMGTPAFVCNPRGGWVTGSVMTGDDPF